VISHGLVWHRVSQFNVILEFMDILQEAGGRQLVGCLVVCSEETWLL